MVMLEDRCRACGVPLKAHAINVHGYILLPKTWQQRPITPSRKFQAFLRSGGRRIPFCSITNIKCPHVGLNVLACEPDTTIVQVR